MRAEINRAVHGAEGAPGLDEVRDGKADEARRQSQPVDAVHIPVLLIHCASIPLDVILKATKGRRDLCTYAGSRRIG